MYKDLNIIFVPEMLNFRREGVNVAGFTSLVVFVWRQICTGVCVLYMIMFILLNIVMYTSKKF